MLTHVLVGANDPEASIAFYDATLGALGIEGQRMGDRAFYSTGEGPTFGVGKPRDGEAATAANGGTIGFVAKDKAAVDAWHEAGLANGGSDEGEPGKRENAPGNAYGAYLRDPAGNKVCTFCALPEGE